MRRWFSYFFSNALLSAKSYPDSKYPNVELFVILFFENPLMIYSGGSSYQKKAIVQEYCKAVKSNLDAFKRVSKQHLVTTMTSPISIKWEAPRPTWNVRDRAGIRK
jgi:hypothetical protein